MSGGWQSAVCIYLTSVAILSQFCTHVFVCDFPVPTLQFLHSVSFHVCVAQDVAFQQLCMFASENQNKHLVDFVWWFENIMSSGPPLNHGSTVPVPENGSMNVPRVPDVSTYAFGTVPIPLTPSRIRGRSGPASYSDDAFRQIT